MARPRKPTEVLEQNGAFEKNPQRRRDPAPKSNSPIGDAPVHLSKVEAAIWREVSFQIPEGVLTEGDRMMFGLFCQLEGKARTRSILAVERSQLIKLLSSMGCTPADRSRISALPQKQEMNDPDAEFTN